MIVSPIGHAAPETPRAWPPRWLSRDLACLFAARALRSFAIGYLGIILPIYIADLGYDAVHLGMLFSISGMTGALLAICIGVLGDRFGRKPFIIIIALMMAVGALGLSLAHNFVLMVAAAAFGTIGYPGGAGGGGGWGPYYPAAQSLVAEHSGDADRTTVFGVLSFVGVTAGALGSLTAALPSLLHRTAGLSMLTGFRLLLLLTALIAVLMALVVMPVREVRRKGVSRYRPDRNPQPSASSVSAGPPVHKRLGLSRDSWRLVSRFMITNATNGLAAGMMGPFVVYWFYRRFGASAAELARLFFFINILASIPYLVIGPFSRRVGLVNTVTLSRGASAVMLAFVVAMPTYPLAAALYVARVVVAVFSVPVRQSFLMGVIEPSERSSAAGFSNTPSQVTQSLSSFSAGWLIQHIALSMPLVLASVLQALNATLYYLFFRNVRPPEELEREAGDELD